MITVQIHGVTIELPRHVKKPGEYKHVATQAELEAAFADGWVLRLHEPVVPVEESEARPVPVHVEEPLVEAPERPEPDTDEDDPDVAAPAYVEPATPKRGRPKRGW